MTDPFNPVGFSEPNQAFRSPDFGSIFSNEAGGEIYRVSNLPQPDPPKNIYQTAQEYVQQSQALNDAVRFQHRVDNIYEQMYNTAPPRDVEVLPPENATEAFNRPRMRSALPPDELPPDLSDVFNRPPTPNNSGARVGQTVDVTPMPAEPRTPWSNAGSMELDRPRNVPGFNKGVVGSTAAGALINFGMNLAYGQPPGQAAAGAVGGAVGGVVGATVGSAFGPVGTFVGGTVGSLVGSAAADYVWNKLFPPAANPSASDPYVGVPPFYGGQGDGVLYQINFSITRQGTDRRSDPPVHRSHTVSYNMVVWGAILGFRTAYVGSGVASTLFILCRGIYQGYQGNSEQFHPGDYKEYSTGFGQDVHLTNPQVSLGNLSISRLDGKTDTAGNPPPDPIQADTRSSESQRHPINNSAPPRAEPQTSNNPAPNNYAPGTTDNKTGGSPRGDSPAWIKPASPQNPSQHPDVHPGNNTNPIPETNPTPQTNTNPNPNTQTFPSNNPNTTSSGGGRFFTDPSLNPNTPTTLPELRKPEPIPQAFKPPQPQSNEPSPNYNDPNNQCQLDPCISGLQRKTQELQDGQKALEKKIDNLVVNNFNTNNNSTSPIIWVSATVPTVTCNLSTETNLYTPTRSNTTIQVQTTATGSELTQIQAQFEEQAKIAESVCHAKNYAIDWIEITVPTVTCNLSNLTNLYTPTRNNTTIKIQTNKIANQTAQVQAEFEELAKLAEAECRARNQDFGIGIPETWAIQPGSGVPQLVITFRPKNLRTGSFQDSKWTISIPHPNYRAMQLSRLRIDPQERGKHMAEATLKDNSKIRVHLLTERKAIAYVEKIVRNYVERSLWTSDNPQDFIKTGIRPGIKPGTIHPYKVEFYRYGMKGAGTPDNHHYFDRGR